MFCREAWLNMLFINGSLPVIITFFFI
jgi:hypothetical protein